MNNWELHKIGNVFTVSSGGTPIRNKPEYYVNGNIPWVKTGDLKGKYVNKPDEFITEEALKSSSAKLFPEKTVLLAMYGATIGACSILPFEAATNQACAALLPSRKCDEIYLYYFLKSYQDELIKMGVGGAQPNISSGKIKQIQIPLPPLSTQQKIAAILDAADAYRQLTKTLIAKYDQLAQSLFLEMFGDPVINPKKWMINIVENILSAKTQNGHYVPKEQYSDNGIAMVHMSDAFYGKVRLENIKRVSISIKEAEKYKLIDSDIILARRSLNYEGAVKPCLVPKIEEPLIYESSLIRLSPNLEKVNTIFLYFYFNNENARKAHVCQYITKSTISGINNKDLNKIKIYVPPITLQNLFAERIQLIEAQKLQAQVSLQKAEELFNSLLQRAFKGELVS